MNPATQSLVVAAGELSPLQQAYQDYFKQKLSDYGVASPAELPDDKKSQFFNEIKKEWPDEKANVSAAALPALVPLYAQRGGYLLRMVAGQQFPSRSQIVAWAASRNLHIDAANIFVRGNVLRIVSSTPGMLIDPQPGLLEALNDESPENLLVEPSDVVAYLSAGVRSQGMIKAYSERGVKIVSELSGVEEEVELSSLMSVKSYAQAATAALTAEQLLSAHLSL